ncbi:MAG: sigma-54-dependent Fis family transcriptional regulator [Planctomycetaceae bacterium]|nr:sigma-54-dependent Fis family transcriptional regulator [Planctomycetaceae bacterium]
MTHVLIIDDEPTICWALSEALADEGFSVSVAGSAEEALRSAEQQRPDIVMTDVRLPGADGLSVLRHFQNLDAALPVIVMTAFGSLEIAVEAVAAGAFDYLVKPFDLQDAVTLVQQAQTALSQRKTDPAENASAPTDEASLLVGDSPNMQAVFRKIAMVASQDVPVLVTGESGTGKELVAQALHLFSGRKQGAFVPVCVPAMNEGLIESELFGHAGGAFTGATQARRGLLQQASGGTAFLDEIGDVALAMQVKLLRVLEEKKVTPVGSNQAVAADFRLVAATNRNLEDMVRQKTFREDLYYRLSTFRIDLPPLRERGDDVILLAKHFLNRFSNAARYQFAPETLDELRSRKWHGNVRELRNAVEHAAILSRSGTILPSALPSPVLPSGSTAAPTHDLTGVVNKWLQSREGKNEPGLLNQFMETIEPILFQHALEVSGGNRSEAAQLLGIHRQTLREKLRRYDMDPSGD